MLIYQTLTSMNIIKAKNFGEKITNGEYMYDNILGKTSLLEYTIGTGEAIPINQKHQIWSPFIQDQSNGDKPNDKCS